MKNEKEKKTKKRQMEDLPDEIIEMILSKMTDHRWVTMQVCRTWGRVQTLPECECVHQGKKSLETALQQHHENCMRLILMWYPCQEITRSISSAPLWVLQHVHKKKGSIFSYALCEHAVQTRDLDKIEWIHQNAPSYDPVLCAECMHHPDLPLLQFLRQKEYAWDSQTCMFAAKTGNLDGLKWLRNQTPPCPWDSTTISVACRNGDRDIVEYAVEHGCPLHMICFVLAAQRHDLRLLDYLLPHYQNN